MLAHKEKIDHVVEERYTPLQDTEVEDLIDEAETQIKVARLQEKIEKSAVPVTYSNLQDNIQKDKQVRNLKLFKTYQKQWKREKNRALLKLSEDLEGSKMNQEVKMTPRRD